MRSDVRDWLRANLPWEWGVGLPPKHDDLAEEVASGRDWQAKLAAAQLVGVTWPEEFGGRGAGPLEHYIVQEELARARAPELVGRIGVNLAGPTLLAHGTPEQKGRWLPGSSTRRRSWCQLFSEPDAGSDLTALRTRATRVDGGWRARRPEGVDLLRPVRRLGHLPRPHRPRRPEAQGHLVLRRRHVCARRRGAPARAAHRRGRVQRGVPQRCLRARRPTRRPAPRRAGGWPTPPCRTSGAPTPASS